MEKNYILITNDDGVDSKQTRLLTASLKFYYDVYQFLPVYNHSGASGSLSKAESILITRVEGGIYTVKGTPIECADAAIKISNKITLKKPILSISGPNFGLNYGKSVYYSGTFMSANEFFQNSIKSISISLEGEFDNIFYVWLAKLISKIENKPELDGLLNLNIKTVENDKNPILVLTESEIIDLDYSYFQIKQSNSNYILFPSTNKRSIDGKSFISVGYYFDSDSRNKENKLIELIKQEIRGSGF